MCKSCEQLRINGVVTHEIGCPDAWRDYTRECNWCGQPFKPEEQYQKCCSHSCTVAYNNIPCDCSECSVDDAESLNNLAELEGEYHGE